MKCPICQGKATKVIYYGLPMGFCMAGTRKENDCNSLFGFWSFIANWLPFNGQFMTYEGAYIKALWHWIKG